jgi:hypothetical protein
VEEVGAVVEMATVRVVAAKAMASREVAPTAVAATEVSTKVALAVLQVVAGTVVEAPAAVETARVVEMVVGCVAERQ